MSYEPMDTYVPGAHGGAQVPQLVGQREGAARSYAASAGWTVHVRHVAVDRRHPDGFVVQQAPAPGSVAPIGAVLAVDVSRRRRPGDRYGRAWLTGACLALAVTTGVFASLWLEERRHAPSIETPDWSGERQQVVEAFARREGLVLRVETQTRAPAADPVTAGAEVGTVVVQSPRPGVPLAPGSAIVITVVADEPEATDASGTAEPSG